MSDNNKGPGPVVPGSVTQLTNNGPGPLLGGNLTEVVSAALEKRAEARRIIPSLIPAYGDSPATVLRKVGLLRSHFSVRTTELLRVRAATADDPFISAVLISISHWLSNLYLDCHNTGWERLAKRIDDLEAAQVNATDPAVRDMLKILVDELAALCVDDEA